MTSAEIFAREELKAQLEQIRKESAQREDMLSSEVGCVLEMMMMLMIDDDD